MTLRCIAQPAVVSFQAAVLRVPCVFLNSSEVGKRQPPCPNWTLFLMRQNVNAMHFKPCENPSVTCLRTALDATRCMSPLAPRCFLQERVRAVHRWLRNEPPQISRLPLGCANYNVPAITWVALCNETGKTCQQVRYAIGKR